MIREILSSSRRNTKNWKILNALPGRNLYRLSWLLQEFLMLTSFNCATIFFCWHFFILWHFANCKLSWKTNKSHNMKKVHLTFDILGTFSHFPLLKIRNTVDNLPLLPALSSLPSNLVVFQQKTWNFKTQTFLWAQTQLYTL